MLIDPKQTRLEVAKDLATALGGLIANTTSAMDRAELVFSTDYGLYQARALLMLAERDVLELIERLK